MKVFKSIEILPISFLGYYKYMTRKLFLLTILLGIFILIFPVFKAHANQPTISDFSQKVTLSQEGRLLVDINLTYESARNLRWDIPVDARAIKVFQADNNIDNFNIEKTRDGQRITTRDNSRNWRINFIKPSNLIRHNDRDQLYLKIFQDTNKIIKNSVVTFVFPQEVSLPIDLSGNTYAIGGIGNSQTEIIGNTVVYTVKNASPDAIFSISASWQKDSLQLSSWERLRLWIMNLEAVPWILIGLLLPLLSLGLLAWIYVKQRTSTYSVDEILNKPPKDLPPVIAGVLVNKKISAPEITATLVDLCIRGYLVIVYKGGGFLLGKRKPFDDHLTPWEKKIVERIFLDNFKIEEEHLQAISQHSLYSPKIREAFSHIYQSVTDWGFFTENPHITRVKYKLLALSLYFLSLIGIIWVVVSQASPYFLIPLIASMFSAQLVLKLSVKLITYSKSGLDARHRWLAYANYLKEPKPLTISSALDQTFEKNLPYAIALKCTQEWAKRFDLTSHTIVRPDWFISYTDTSTGQFVQEVIKFGNTISKSLSNLKGPLVK